MTETTELDTMSVDFGSLSPLQDWMEPEGLANQETEPPAKRVHLETSSRTSTEISTTNTRDQAAARNVTYNMINNEFFVSKSRSWTRVLDPATQKTLTKVPQSTLMEIQRAVSIAEASQIPWAKTNITARRQKILDLRDVLRQNEFRIKQTLCTEIGKTIHEAEAEYSRGIEALETACAVATDICGNHWRYQTQNTHTVHEPLGVCVTITPFTFPFMLPLYSIPFALIAGNSVVFKPSEKAPTAAMILAESFVKAGFPPGVFNVVHGKAAAVSHLLAQPVVQAVSFIGSESAAIQVCEQANQTQKRIQAECSGKNHAVVLEDAEKSATLRAIVASAFGAAGQRCNSLSVVIFVGSTSQWIGDLAAETRELKVGCGLDPATQVGPLITSEAKDKVERVIEMAETEGAQIVLDGRNHIVPGYPNGNFVGPTIISNVQTFMECYQEEIFGPVLVCVAVKTLSMALEIINENSYGVSCTLFTRDPRSAQLFQEEVNVGQVGINVPILAAFGPVLRTSNKRSALADPYAEGRNHWQFFTKTKTITSLWR